MVLGNKNWKEITILPENPLAKDFEVRFKGKKVLATKVTVILDSRTNRFVELDEL